MKESRLADFYIDILGLAKSSHDAFLLKGWEQQARATRSDFAEAVYEVLKGRLTGKAEGNVSIARINEQLDELFLASDKKAVFAQLVYGLGPEEHRWLVRIILKTLKTGIGDAMVLKCVHPDAMELYNMTMNLRRVCTELTDTSKRINGELQGRLELFSPFQPMLAARAALADTFELCGATEEAIVEPKLDGERMQLHYDGTAFRYWSRRGTEYTYLYGSSKDEPGSLTPYIADEAFQPSVQSAILDGEMLAYDPISKDFMPFGTLKGAAESGGEIAKKIHDPHPCFVAFDIVYLNGETLLSKPLLKRKRLLEASVREVQGRFLVIEGTLVHNIAEISAQMDLALSNKLEGIIVKGQQSKYVVGRRPYDWIKLKPDYVDDLCDDLDLLIVGASYGRGIGGTPGSLSSFTCAVKDGERFRSLCRVGSGLSIGELDRLRARLGPHLAPFDSKRPPAWLDFQLSLPDRPDVVLNHPSLSIVIQVKATQIIESKQYPAGYTLRHPRYIREREDRTWDSAMTIEELRDLFRAEQGSLAKRRMATLPAGGTSAKRGRAAPRGKWSQARLASEFATIDASKVERSGQDIFKGREVHVVAGEPAGGLDKPGLERCIVEAGGRITQAPVAGSTFCVISGRDDGLRLGNIKKQGTLDVFRSSWLADSLAAGQLLPPLSKYVIHATPDTARAVANLKDRYGDSFVEDISEAELKQLLTRSDWPHEEVGHPDLISDINDRYLSDII